METPQKYRVGDEEFETVEQAHAAFVRRGTTRGIKVGDYLPNYRCSTDRSRAHFRDMVADRGSLFFGFK